MIARTISLVLIARTRRQEKNRSVWERTWRRTERLERRGPAPSIDIIIIADRVYSISKRKTTTTCIVITLEPFSLFTITQKIKTAGITLTVLPAQIARSKKKK